MAGVKPSMRPLTRQEIAEFMEFLQTKKIDLVHLAKKKHEKDLEETRFRVKKAMTERDAKGPRPTITMRRAR